MREFSCSSWHAGWFLVLWQADDSAREPGVMIAVRASHCSRQEGRAAWRDFLVGHYKCTAPS